jgi:hypothetical protein
MYFAQFTLVVILRKDEVRPLKSPAVQCSVASVAHIRKLGIEVGIVGGGK